ncbi:hypothetical protein MMC06_003705 [Schaereria dolodes]|nr:hypothetical protein [Schaereria dolodes]
MLLVHQSGSLKIGEVVRYTLTYTPSNDRILPPPHHLHVKVRNTSAIPLRAAYLHGPYTIYAACYPSTFDPNHKPDQPLRHGTPNFEPNLKAGGSWNAQLTVPENIRETAGKANVRRTTDGGIPNFTWIIEVSSQVIFSTSAAVHFEILVGRDEKSVELGFTGLTTTAQPTPGQLQDHQQGKRSKDGHGAAQPKGVYSKAIRLVVDDTTSLWSKPALPEWSDEGKDRGQKRERPDITDDDKPSNEFNGGLAEESEKEDGLKPKTRKRRKVHLVVLTHGLHSNLGADMLYLKESIDATAKQARLDAKKRRAKDQTKQEVHRPESRDSDKTSATSPSASKKGTSTAPLSGGQADLRSTSQDDSDDEEVIVRGFGGNAVRTERGIQYLGKRLAKYVLSMTYPDQPFLPVKKSVTKSLSRAFTGQEPHDAHAGFPSHHNSSIHREAKSAEKLAYQITSISFIGHSLGGLTQTYAIAYIHKHSPHFFDKIKPINFIGLASPFLGLSNENPIYVKFALDFGLVGRTGQDLGLTWRAPTMVRSGWGAMIGGIGSEGKRTHRQQDPGTKPLLRILPIGPAHQVLKLFRNRTVYSNVVNDGIVPLRTSCMLFLDWRGLGRVEKARRENGLVGTMAGWGWAEITGANSTSHRHRRGWSDGESSSQGGESGDEGGNISLAHGDEHAVPQPDANATKDDNTKDEQSGPTNDQRSNSDEQKYQIEEYNASKAHESSPQQPSHSLGNLLSFLHPGSAKKPHHHSRKQKKIYSRSQTIKPETDDEASQSSDRLSSPERPKVARRDSLVGNPNDVFAPPKTTFFESAGDILNPPLPDEEFLIDPSSRPRSIFHDRVYHPEDIPPPPARRRPSFLRSLSGDAKESASKASMDIHDTNSNRSNTSDMKVEEKIARAYHRDLSWRKVLVRLEPDAHNNMVVRRMFANAYGWPVVKHLCDTHFADTYAAATADQKEPNVDRAKPMDEAVSADGGEEVRGQLEKQHDQTASETREAKDEVNELVSPAYSHLSSSVGRPRHIRADSAQWDDSVFDGTDDDDDDEDIEYLARHTSEDSVGTSHSKASWEETNLLNPSSPHVHESPQTTRRRVPSITLNSGPIVAPILSTSPTRTTVSVGLQKPIEERIMSREQSEEKSTDV